MIQLKNLIIRVNADGSNGLTTCLPAEARRRGIYSTLDPVPLCTYHPADWGKRSAWLPAGRGPYGLDAPESGGKIVYTEEGEGYRGWGFLVIDGEPYRQRNGFYLSLTALQNHGHPVTDPRRYFDSVSLPGWTIPKGGLPGVRLGDLALVMLQGRAVWAQAFDQGTESLPVMELSPNACEQLGLSGDARTGGGPGVEMTILPGSRSLYADRGNVVPWSREQAEQAAATYLKRGSGCSTPS